MSKKNIIVAPFDNKKAWKDADYICDGVDDQVEIQATIDLAAQLKTKPKLRKGTYNISGARVLPED